MRAIVEQVAAWIEAERRVPLGATVLCESAARTPGDKCERLELTSRGDRVALHLWRPTARERRPLVLLQYGLGQRVDALHHEAAALLVDEGLAVATVDWPLHGERASAKFGARLLAALDPRLPDPGAGPLVRQFVAQAALDVARALDAVIAIGAADASRIALLGRGLGAALLALAAAADPRPAALVLSPANDVEGPPELALAELLAEGRARPVLLVPAAARTSGSAPTAALRSAVRGELRTVAAPRGPAPVDAALAREIAAVLKGAPR